jgi:hypothetical protein
MKMPAPDDEDTLSGLEGVPAVDTMVVPPDQIDEAVTRAREEGAARREEEATSRRGAHVRLIATMLFLLGIAAVLVVWGLLR